MLPRRADRSTPSVRVELLALASSFVEILTLSPVPRGRTRLGLRSYVESSEKYWHSLSAPVDLVISPRSPGTRRSSTLLDFVRFPLGDAIIRTANRALRQRSGSLASSSRPHRTVPAQGNLPAGSRAAPFVASERATFRAPRSYIELAAGRRRRTSRYDMGYSSSRGRSSPAENPLPCVSSHRGSSTGGSS